MKSQMPRLVGSILVFLCLKVSIKTPFLVVMCSSDDYKASALITVLSLVPTAVPGVP